MFRHPPLFMLMEHLSARNPLFDGVVFDMDGTLTVPALDFRVIRGDIGLPPDGDIIELIESMPEDDRRRAWEIIGRHERRLMRENRLQSGVVELLDALIAAEVPLALLTRNTVESVSEFSRLVGGDYFNPVLTRESRFIKPDHRAVASIVEEWGINPSKALVVGDYIDDLTCGADAGAKTCFFANPDSCDYSKHADFRVESHWQLADIIFA